MHLQERFSECGSVTMARYKLAQLKQVELPMQEYIAKCGDMTEYAYNIKAMDSLSAILSLNFIKGVQYPYIKNNTQVISSQKPEGNFWSCHSGRPKTKG